MRHWRIHKSQFVTVYTSEMDIVMDDAITGKELKRKTVGDKYLPYIDELFIKLGTLYKTDIISKHERINNTSFIFQNGNNPSFIFPSYIRPLIECCYIVAHRLGATLEEIGYTRGYRGYQVQFMGVGNWAA